MVKSIRSVFFVMGFLIGLSSCGLGQAVGRFDKNGKNVVITIDADRSKASKEPLDKQMFGKFFEYNGCDAYPGIYADHLANGSFEVWNTSGNRTAVLYNDTKHYTGIAYPWEPVQIRSKVAYQQVKGGVNGRKAEPDLDYGPEIIPNVRPKPIGIKHPRFERIELNNSEGGVKQRTALPDKRTRKYIVKFSERGQLTGDLTVCLEDLKGNILAQKQIAVSDSWKRHDVTLDLDKLSNQRYHNSPFGEYALCFIAKGTGHVDLDWVMLMSGDAVQGKFNPTTIKLLKAFHVTSIRWPGGNFASQYHWKDGIGPLKDRPVVPNANWGGFERNYLGTDEFLEFCKILGIKPIITVSTWSAISPKEIAEWVQYVNGDTNTKYGRLRAKDGYPKPWNVKNWQIGNEVWGRYQVGHLDAEKYAERYKKIYKAMKKVDPDIEIDATGIDPYYTDYDDGSYRDRYNGKPPTWNKILFKDAGTLVHGVDIHRYTHGITRKKERDLWLKKNNMDPIGYNEVLVNFPTEYEQLLKSMRKLASQYGIKKLRINIGEWNLTPSVDRGWPRANYPTMAHASYMASMFNTYIKLGDVVSYMRDNTLYWRPYPVDLRPIFPGLYAERFYAEPFTEKNVQWHDLPVKTESPTFTIPKTGIRIDKMTGVPFVDASGIISGNGKEVYVFATNRNLRNTYRVKFHFVDKNTVSNTRPDQRPEINVVLQTPDHNDPFLRQTDWYHPNSFQIKKYPIKPDAEGNAYVNMPPSSIVRLSVTLNR